jgi:aldose sugar dehydrogenase
MNIALSLRARTAVRNAATASLLSLFALVPSEASRAEVAVGEPQSEADRLPPTPQEVPDSEFPYELRKIGGVLQSPWAMAWLPDGRMLVTERPGRLRIIEGDRMLPESIRGVPEVMTGGHSGLLDVLVDKDFPRTHRLFLTYMHGTPDAATIRVASATLDEMTLIDKKVIFESRPALKGTDQIGGRLAFGPDGHLYLTIGERMQQYRAQNLLDDGGKIIRIRDDGSIPEDNPFVGHPDALPEIFSYGHRNPQGLISTLGDGQIWSVEQGPKGGDELNLITRGGDYGWPLVTFGTNYDGTIISDKTSAPGLIDPIYHWTPSLATANLAAYPGGVMPDDWRGNLLIGGLSGEILVRLVLSEGKVVQEYRYLHHTIGRIRDVATGPDGYIYLLTDGTEASIYRLEPLTDTVAGRSQ